MEWEGGLSLARVGTGCSDGVGLAGLLHGIEEQLGLGDVVALSQHDGVRWYGDVLHATKGWWGFVGVY